MKLELTHANSTKMVILNVHSYKITPYSPGRAILAIKRLGKVWSDEYVLEANPSCLYSFVAVDEIKETV